MSANTPAARDILGLSSPEFIQIPDTRAIVRLDALLSVSTRGQTQLVLRLSNSPSEMVITCPSHEACIAAFDELLKNLTE